MVLLHAEIMKIDLDLDHPALDGRYAVMGGSTRGTGGLVPTNLLNIMPMGGAWK